MMDIVLLKCVDRVLGGFDALWLDLDCASWLSFFKVRSLLQSGPGDFLDLVFLEWFGFMTAAGGTHNCWQGVHSVPVTAKRC